MISLYIVSALVFLFFEYFFLLKLYRRSKTLETISLIVAPIITVIGLWISLFIQKQLNITPGRLNPIVLFVVFASLELPLSIYGYEIQPNASILERIIVVGTFGTASVLIANALIGLF